MSDALAGLRVVDLSWGLAGALTTLVLGDYGAEIVRVEPPDGDVLRGEPAYPLWGRNKKSVTVDLRQASGRAAIRRLVERADVVVTTFRPATARKLRLAYDDFADQHPGLVYASITGFGTRGRYANVPGYEGIVMAKMGAMSHVTGMAPRPGPAFPAVPYASYSAAHAALHGILAALYVRERTGRGQLVETSLAQAVAAHDPWEWFLRVLCAKRLRTVPNASALPGKVTRIIAMTGTGRFRCRRSRRWRGCREFGSSACKRGPARSKSRPWPDSSQ